MRRVRLLAIACIILLSFVVLLRATMPTVQTGTWASAGQMGVARAGAVSVPLPDGRIMIIGGADATGAPTASAEFFNPDGTFSPAPSMSMPRSGHAAVWLADGEVLVTGGITMSGAGATNAAEIFDPLTGHWTTLSSTMLAARSGHTMTQLLDGNVLIAGGRGAGGAPVNTLEILQLGSRQFSAAGTLQTARFGHAADVLEDGRVFIAGGSSLNGDGSPVTLASTEIFDPAKGVTAGPTLNPPRAGASVTTLLDGTVLIAGGSYPEGAAQGAAAELDNIDVFNPADGSLNPAPAKLTQARSGHQAFLLPHNANVLFVGGTFNGSAVASAEQYTPWTGVMKATTMAAARTAATGSPLNVLNFYRPSDGLILIAGGKDASGTPQTSGELYRFATVTTDKIDYSPGQTVTITGSGWQPNETITLSFRERPSIDTPGPFTVTADANGNFVDSEFAPDANDVNVRFYLTAVGASSGLQAQHTFTDKVATVTIESCSPNPVQVNQTAVCTATVDVDGQQQASLQGTITIAVAPTDAGTLVVDLASCNNVGPSKTLVCNFTYTPTTLTGVSLTAHFESSTSGSVNSSTSLPLPITVTPTTLTLSAPTPNPVSLGSSGLVSFAATLSVSSTPISGATISFTVDGAFAGTATTNGSGIATLSNYNPSALGLGNHNVVASFTGDGTHAAATSDPQVLTVSQTALTITANSTSKTYGQTVTFAGTEFSTTGLQAGDSVTSVTLASTGAAATAAVGSYDIVPSDAVGTGLSKYTISYHNGSLTVNQATPTVIATGGTFDYDGNPHAGSGTATGVLSPPDNLTPVTLSYQGTGSTTYGPTATAPTNVGTYTVTASFAGDTNYKNASSAAVPLTIGAIAPSFSNLSAPAIHYGDTPTTLSGTIKSGTIIPTGNVSITLNGVTHNAAIDSITGNFSSSFVTGALDVANSTYTITYSYAGDTNFSAVLDNTKVLTVLPALTTTLPEGNPATSVYGQPVTITVTITAQNSSLAAPTSGTVELKIYPGTNTTATPILNTTLTLDGSSNIVTYGPNSSLPVGGPRTVVATYIPPTGPPPSNYAGSFGSFTHNVIKADTTATVSSSGNPTVFGQSVTFTATVNVTAPGAGTPTGTVTFYDNGVSIGTGSVTSGQATLTTSSLAVGTHPITVVYGGDGNFNASPTSPSINQVVDKASTSAIVVTSLTPSKYGQAVTFTATVSVTAPGAGTPSGIVTFKDGTTSIGTGTLASGQTTLSSSTLAVGNHTITVEYGGDTSFNASTSPSITQVVQQQTPSVTVNSSSNPSTYGDSMTFTATVVSPISPLPAGAAGPTGNVNFYDGTCTAGTLLNVSPVALNSSGVATFSTSALDAHTHTITACYLGDTNYTTNNGSTSQTVNPLAISVTGLTVNQKVYDATTAATLNFSGASLVGVLTGDVGSVSLVQTGYTANFSDANVGVGKSVTVSGLTLTGARAGNYTLTQPTGLTGTIIAANTTTSVTTPVAAQVTFGGGATNPVTLTARVIALTPNVIPGVIVNEGMVTFSIKQGATEVATTTAAVSGGLATTTYNYNALGVGPYAVTASYTDAASTYVNFNPSSSSNSGTFTINPYPVSAGLAPIRAVVQYSDQQTLRLTVPNTGVNGQTPITEGTTTASFFVGTQKVADAVSFTCTGGTCVASTTFALLENPNGNGQMAPGIKTATATLTNLNPNFTLSSLPSTMFTIAQENATVFYTGFEVFYGPVGSSSMTINMTYQVQDASVDNTQPYWDGNPGDITKAKVKLTLSPTDGGPAQACTPTALSVSKSVTVGTMTLPSVATFGCTFTVAVPENYTATVQDATGSYYSFLGDDAILSITTENGGTGFITGGGHQTKTYLAAATGGDKYAPFGLFVPADNRKLNFGFVAKYNKKGSNLQGQANIIVRAQCMPAGVQGTSYAPIPGDDGLCTYQIKSNNPTSLTDVPGTNTQPGQGGYVGGAILQDVTWPTVQSLGGGGVFTVQLVVYDVAEPGTGKDTIGIQLTDKNGVIWLSNNWSGTKTVTSATAPVIQGGNIQVH